MQQCHSIASASDLDIKRCGARSGVSVAAAAAELRCVCVCVSERARKLARLGYRAFGAATESLCQPERAYALIPRIA